MGNNESNIPTIDSSIFDVLGAKLFDEPCKLWQENVTGTRSKQPESFQFDEQNIVLLFGEGRMGTFSIKQDINSALTSSDFENVHLFLTPGKLLFAKQSSPTAIDLNKVLDDAKAAFELQETYLRIGPDLLMLHIPPFTLQISHPTLRPAAFSLIQFHRPAEAKEWKDTIEREIQTHYLNESGLPKSIKKGIHCALHRSQHEVFKGAEKLYHRCNLPDKTPTAIVTHLYTIFAQIVGIQAVTTHIDSFVALLARVSSNFSVRLFVFGFSLDSNWSEILLSYQEWVIANNDEYLSTTAVPGSSSTVGRVHHLLSLIRLVDQKTSRKEWNQNKSVMAKALDCPVDASIDSIKFCRFCVPPSFYLHMI